MAEPRLVITDAHGRRVVPIAKPLFTIGRRTAADLQLTSTDVSREHADIACDGEACVLRDRGSRYGTYVNGEPVSERALTSGDRIRFGRTDAAEMVFELHDSDSTGLRVGASDTTDLRQMAAILNGLRALGSGRVLDEVLALVIDSALDVSKAERGFIMLANAGGELEFRIARGAGQVTLPGTSFPTSAKIPREVFQSARGRMVADLMDAGVAPAHDGTIAIGIRHVICVPLIVSPIAAGGVADGTHRVIGVLYLDGRERSRLLSPATLTSLEAFATQAALAIESARLYAESAEKARVDRDLRVAADIQRALLPNPSHDGPLYALVASTVPCRTIGGDFFDYFDLPDGALAFALGDVAGKGPPAALLAARLQSHFMAHAPVSNDPADAMSRMNAALLYRAVEARFATMFYGLANTAGELRYCNAGQEPPAVVSARGIQWLDTGGPVVGLLPGVTYDCGSVVLERGDVVVVCSDGVTEARDVAGEEFGRDRLAAALTAAHGADAETVLERVTAAVDAFAEGAPQADDITILVLARK